MRTAHRYSGTQLIARHARFGASTGDARSPTSGHGTLAERSRHQHLGGDIARSASVQFRPARQWKQCTHIWHIQVHKSRTTPLHGARCRRSGPAPVDHAREESALPKCRSPPPRASRSKVGAAQPPSASFRHPPILLGAVLGAHTYLHRPNEGLRVLSAGAGRPNPSARSARLCWRSAAKSVPRARAEHCWSLGA